MNVPHARTVSWNVTCTSSVLGQIASQEKADEMTGSQKLARTGRRRLVSGLLVSATIAGLVAIPAGASNLLVNPSFEQPTGGGQFIPTSWTFFEPTTSSRHDYWIVDTNSVNCNHYPPQSGSLYWKQWNALYAPAPTNNVAGIYQTLSSSPGSTYQANGWMATCSGDQLGADSFAWMQVEFLNSSSNLIRLFKSDNFSAAVGADTWFQYQVTNACDLTQPVSTGDPYFTTYAITGSVSQLTAPSGTAFVRFRYCVLSANGEGGSTYVDNTALNQVSGNVPPVISNLFPQDTMIFVNPTSGISFNVSSPSGFTINSNGIHMTMNGADVSGSLSISGSASSKNVTYSGLQSNATYTASISVTDVSNLMVSASIQFQTMWYGLLTPTYLWEAEDWDFTNGMYINNPDLCSASGDPNCYFGKVGVQTVDENNSAPHPDPYRSGDLMGTLGAGDALRPNLFNANRTDYRIDPFITGEWVNYTRDWPNSTNWIIGRISANVGDSGTLTLSAVNADSSTTALGTFAINGGLGYSMFENVNLLDTNGNRAVVVLNGKKTLRVTTGGNLIPNFFMLVPAQPDLPQLSNMYPTGTHPFEPTNTFSFTVTATGSSFPANGIQLNLDGNNVSTNLVITGSASTRNVVYPTLLSNATHLAILTLTNVLGHGIAVTNLFDTFSESNNMVECEDFDYGGGQYITNWSPDAYYDLNGPYPAVTNVDFQHTSLNGEVFRYRAIGIPQDNLNANDYLRSNFRTNLAPDYVLVFFAGGDWANYTRDYPPGAYYAYIRTSGDGPFTMYLDQLVSGQGTVNQVTRRLGQFSAVGKNYTTYQWVPLTDAGMVAPTVVKLNGVSTLRLTTAGNCNPNYFMLVPTSGINLTAKRTGGNIMLSFPTQTGVEYSVFYRTNSLTTGAWTTLTNVLGNGAVISVTDPTAGGGRFYKVVAP